MKNILILVFVFLVFSIQGQQLPIINQFSDNLSLFNPSAVSSEYMKNNYSLQAGLNYRTQWVGLDGAPITQSLMINKLFDSNGSFKISMGGNIINDQVGPIGTTGVYGRISSVFGTGRLSDGIFSAGLNIGVNQFRIDFDEIDFVETEFIDQGNTNFIYPDVGVGIFYARELDLGFFSGDLFYAGASVPQLFAFQLQKQNKITSNDFRIDRTQHFYANIGFVKYYDDDRYMEIATWVKYLNGDIFHADIIAKFKLNESFWIGGGFSSNGSVSLETGSYLYDIIGNDTGLKISYAFVNYFQENSVNLNVSHEITIQYLLQQGRRRYSF